MASVTYGDKIYGARDLKVTNIGGTTQEDLGGIQSLSVELVFAGDTLKGDDITIASINFPTHGEGSMAAGTISSAALAIMTGKSLSTSGTTPNEITTLQIDAGDNMPYFKIYGKAVGAESTDDMHLLLYKVKLSSLNAFSIENESWRITEIEFMAFDDGSNGILKLVQNETAAALPSS